MRVLSPVSRKKGGGQRALLVPDFFFKCLYLKIIFMPKWHSLRWHILPFLVITGGPCSMSGGPPEEVTFTLRPSRSVRVAQAKGAEGAAGERQEDERISDEADR